MDKPWRPHEYLRYHRNATSAAVQPAPAKPHSGRQAVRPPGRSPTCRRPSPIAATHITNRQPGHAASSHAATTTRRARHHHRRRRPAHPPPPSSHHPHLCHPRAPHHHCRRHSTTHSTTLAVQAHAPAGTARSPRPASIPNCLRLPIGICQPFRYPRRSCPAGLAVLLAAPPPSAAPTATTAGHSQPARLLITSRRHRHSRPPASADLCCPSSLLVFPPFARVYCSFAAVRLRLADFRASSRPQRLPRA